MSAFAPRRSAVRSAGFSLVELMLAMGLGLIVTFGIVQLFIGNSQTNTLLTGQARLQESARYALDFISESARGAGYVGCDPDPDKVYNTLNGDWTQLFEFDITRPIEAFDYVGDGGTDAGDWTPSLARVPQQPGGGGLIDGNGVDLDSVAAGTDIVVFRRVETPGFRAAAIVQPNADPVIVDDGSLDLEPNDFAVISNCEQAALFRITAVAAGGGQATLVRGVGGGTFDNSPVATLSELNVAYGDATTAQGTVVGRVVTDVYFVARGVGTNNRDEPTVALWRRSGTAAPVELVEGVHDLQVRFGVDTTPDDDVFAPNRYVDFGALTATDIVRAMRIEVTASTVDVVTESDAPVLRTFSTTVNFRNTG